MQLGRILAGTDGSERAEEAVRQAAVLAAAARASLDVVYVVDTGRPHRDAEAEAESALERAGSRAGSAGVRPELRIVAGDPAKVLLEQVSLGSPDLLCVGPDAGLLGGAIRMGQVAAHVVREARCTVMIARPATGGFPQRVVCGVDGSEASSRTAGLAAAIAAASTAELRLVHVIPVFRGDEREWTLEDDEPSPPEVEGPLAAARAAGVTPIREMAMGRPEHALVKVVERDGADLLVVGHRGVSGVRRRLLGSVSEYCAHHAPCSVIVARLGDGA